MLHTNTRRQIQGCSHQSTVCTGNRQKQSVGEEINEGNPTMEYYYIAVEMNELIIYIVKSQKKNIK